MLRSALLSALLAAALTPAVASAQQSLACYGGDGIRMQLMAERYGEHFEVWGQIASAAHGHYQLKADGWSGAGRLFQRHEYESGARYIRLSAPDATGITLQVEGLGAVRLAAMPCR